MQIFKKLFALLLSKSTKKSLIKNRITIAVAYNPLRLETVMSTKNAKKYTKQLSVGKILTARVKLIFGKSHKFISQYLKRFFPFAKKIGWGKRVKMILKKKIVKKGDFRPIYKY